MLPLLSGKNVFILTETNRSKSVPFPLAGYGPPKLLQPVRPIAAHRRYWPSLNGCTFCFVLFCFVVGYADRKKKHSSDEYQRFEWC